MAVIELPKVGSCEALVYAQQWYRSSGLVQRAVVAAGPGNVEEKLVRLTVWVGTVIPSAIPRDAPVKEAEELFIRGEGWCRQQAKLFAYLARKVVGVESRALGLLHENGKDGHVVAEAYYDQGWHLFDPSTAYMCYCRSVHDGHILSYEELHTDPMAARRVGVWCAWGSTECESSFERFFSRPFRDVHIHAEFDR